MAVAADVTTITEETASGLFLFCYSAVVMAITDGEITDAAVTASSGLSYSYAAAVTEMAAVTTTS